MINKSKILYPRQYNKKTADWAQSLGLQLPYRLRGYDSNNSISDITKKSNTDNSQYSIKNEDAENETRIENTNISLDAPEAFDLLDIHNQIKQATIKGISPETAGFLQALAEKSGVSIELGTIYQNGVRMPGAEGSYDAATNTIRFSPGSTRADVVRGVFMHELTHSIEGSGDYRAYRDFALNYMFGRDKTVYNAAITAKQAQYAGDGIELSTEAAEKEIIAEFTRGTLFADEKAVDRLVQSNPSIARKIYEAIKKAMESIKAYFGNANSHEYLELERGRNLFEKALGEKGKNANVDQSLSIKNSLLMGNVAFIDKKLIKQKNGESFNAAVRRFFNKHFKGMEVETLKDENSVTFDQIGKYLYPGKAIEDYNTKRVAGNILDDIIRVSENKRHLPDLMINGQKKSHAGLDASGGWDYYDTKFAVDNSGIIWGGTVIARVSKNGKAYFYDLDKIKEVGYQDVNEFNPVKYSLSTSDNSISKNSEKSNTDNSQYSIKNEDAENETRIENTNAGLDAPETLSLMDIHNQIIRKKKSGTNRIYKAANREKGWQPSRAAKRFLEKENPQDIIGIDKTIPKDGIYNRESPYVMLGKFDGGGASGYIEKADGDHMYFNLGNNWDVIKQTYRLSDEDMFYLFNIPFLDEIIRNKKTVRFSHDPVADSKALRKEFKYLMKKGYEYNPEELIAYAKKGGKGDTGNES